MSQLTCWLIQSSSRFELGNSLTWLQNLGQETRAGGDLFWPACGGRRHIGQRMRALLPLFLSVGFKWSKRESQENGMEELKSHETSQLSSPPWIYPWTSEPVRPQNRNTTDPAPQTSLLLSFSIPVIHVLSPQQSDENFRGTRLV